MARKAGNWIEALGHEVSSHSAVCFKRLSHLQVAVQNRTADGFDSCNLQTHFINTDSNWYWVNILYKGILKKRKRKKKVPANATKCSSSAIISAFLNVQVLI